LSTRVEIPPRIAQAAPELAPASAPLRIVYFLGRFARRKPLGALGALIVVAMLLMAGFAEQIAPYGYDDTIRGARMKPPSAAHWLGTDNLSRDMWSRIVYGARVSITVGFATIALAVLLATAVGVSSGYFGGAYDLIVQRVVDAWLSFPYLVIVLSVMAVLGPGLLNVVLSLAVIIAAVKAALGARVSDVRASQRLTDSAACLVAGGAGPDRELDRLLARQNRGIGAKPILEINPDHSIVKRLQPGDAAFAEWAGLLFDQAVLAEGGQLDDPAGFVRRSNDLMLSLVK